MSNVVDLTAARRRQFSEILPWATEMQLETLLGIGATEDECVFLDDCLSDKRMTECEVLRGLILGARRMKYTMRRDAELTPEERAQDDAEGERLTATWRAREKRRDRILCLFIGAHRTHGACSGWRFQMILNIARTAERQYGARVTVRFYRLLFEAMRALEGPPRTRSAAIERPDSGKGRAPVVSLRREARHA